ncbi:hypothetical protein Salat_0878800 [Sesamum alatum]|uniref:Reverse transcriptase zinc-binding domain-containing protein n=1 Tax=Sesamum alatum TaxID=300844 RepID=A0AAE1YJD3_9LAMI|nr:hypothetical protein Salat_0878800 [Sesamum alatum]
MYKLAISRATLVSPSITVENWRFLWNSQVLPRIHMFAWQCAQGTVPTPHNLEHRGLREDLKCVQCGVAPEDIIHILFTSQQAHIRTITPPGAQSGDMTRKKLTAVSSLMLGDPG